MFTSRCEMHCEKTLKDVFLMSDVQTDTSWLLLSLGQPCRPSYETTNKCKIDIPLHFLTYH